MKTSKKRLNSSKIKEKMTNLIKKIPLIKLYYRYKYGCWIEPPECFGTYLDNGPPTVIMLNKLGCLKCPYWTYKKHGCIIASIEKIGPLMRVRKKK